MFKISGMLQSYFTNQSILSIKLNFKIPGIFSVSYFFNLNIFLYLPHGNTKISGWASGFW